MSIRLKLLFGCLCLTLVTLVLGTFAQHSQTRIGRLAVQIYDDALIATNALRSAQTGLVRLDARFRGGESPLVESASPTPPQIEHIDSEMTAVMAELRVADEGALSPAGHERVDAIQQRLSRVKLSEGALSGRLLLRELATLNEEIGAAVRVFSADAYQVRVTVGSLIETSVNRTWMAMGVATLIALAISFVLSRTIVPALRNAMAIAKSIAAGNFDNRIEPIGRSETAELLEALAVMQDSISRHFGQIETDAAVKSDAYDGQIATQNARFEAALDNMTQALCMFDAKAALVIVNRRFLDLFGPVVIGQPMAELAKLPQLAAVFARGRAAFFTQPMADGTMIAVSRQGIAAGGQVFTFEDVTERHNAALRLEHMAAHDALTGLPNRIRLAERLADVLAKPASAKAAAVLCLDLDGFKFVNDTLGHPVGDVLLKAVADRLSAAVGEGDLVARIGGDEFAILQLAPGRQPAAAEALARQIIERLSQPFDIDHQRITIGVSIGIVAAQMFATFPDEGDLGAMLMKSADLALYAAKARGRNTHCFFQPAMEERVQARRRTEIDLASALENGEFELFYQPFVNVARQQLSGFEALVRWRHPVRGMVSPAEFIPIAEEVGLIDALGLFVLETACRQAAGWPAGLVVSVNLSPVQFRDPHLLDDVRRVLEETGLDARRLQLEITESVLLHDTESVLAILKSFRKLGIGVSMDDFGTGYSSLGYLSRFPFDKVKIDQSFVRDLSKRENRAVVRAVLGLSKAMGIAAIAEGVESAEQRDILLSEGCEEMQGYYFSRPRPVSDLPQLLMRFGLGSGLDPLFPSAAASSGTSATGA